MSLLSRQTQDITNYFHVITRGINGDYIFDQDEEKSKILSLYSQADRNWKILGYCIMSNHTHFLIEVDQIQDLSKEMKSVNIKYSNYYNKKHNRKGYLFQNRFKSVAILNENQLYQNLRYIHNNPQLAHIVKSREEYKYSSYNEFFQKSLYVDKDFVEKIRNNYKNELEFKKFHDQKTIELLDDVEEDLENIKKQIIEKISNKKDQEKIKILYQMGMTKYEISKILKLGRKTVEKI